MRSLYCLIWVATLKRVSIPVEGWALASAVCDNVWVRRAWGRTEAAHASSSRMALARKVVADVRSLCRSHLTALISFSQFPRAQ